MNYYQVGLAVGILFTYQFLPVAGARPGGAKQGGEDVRNALLPFQKLEVPIKFSAKVPSDGQSAVQKIADLVLTKNCNRLKASVDARFQWGPRDPEPWAEVCNPRDLRALATTLLSGKCVADFKKGIIDLTCNQGDVLSFRKTGLEWKWYMLDFPE